MRIATAIAVILALLASGSADAQRRYNNAPPDTVVAGVNAFAADLYGLLAAGNTNIVFSPYSISAAMVFPMLGAAGETAQEIRAAMRYPEYDNLLHGGTELLERSLRRRAAADSLELDVANALWADNDLGVTQRYQSHLKRIYGLEVERTSFHEAPEAARVAINKWTSKQTHDRINDLFAPGTIDSDTRLVVVNAIYFHAPWLTPFPKDQTEKAPFKRSDDTDRVEVDMMHVQNTFPYAETDAYQALELPYRGDKFSMLVLLPKDGHDLADVESTITDETIAALVSPENTHPREVNVYLPRFRMEYTRVLNHALIDLGMTSAFQENADFSGISLDTQLQIALVVHKAFIDVAEEGTEAAAATGVGIATVSLEHPPVPTFRADHPFVFFIKDNASGVILFMGRVMDPTS